MSRLHGILIAACCIVITLVRPARAQTAYDGFDPGANDAVLALATQPDNKILVGGRFTTLGGGGTGTSARHHLGRLNPNGSIDETFDPGANDQVYAFAIQPDGKILAAGLFTTLGGGGTGTTPRHRIGRLNADGSVDASFDPNANNDVYRIAIQPDGRILVAGAFTNIAGAARNCIARLNADGSVDPAFDPGADGPVSAVTVQPNGQILVGGSFTMLGGGGSGKIPRLHLGRLNASGSIDAAFNPGADDRVDGFALQADGRIIVVGEFTYIAGAFYRGVARLFPGGSPDYCASPGNFVRAVIVQRDGKIVLGGNFGNPFVWGYHVERLNANCEPDSSFRGGADDQIFALAEQADGKLLVGGLFTTLGDSSGPPTPLTPRSHVGRFYPDGSVDVTFDPGANGYVRAVALQPDGHVLVGGSFTMLGGGGNGTTPRSFLGRFYSGGESIPGVFAATNGPVLALAVQPDGRIVVGGSFTTVNGQARHRIARLDAGGLEPDSSFPDIYVDGPVYALALQADGKILVGGGFSILQPPGSTGTEPTRHLARLNANGSLDSTFAGWSDSDVYTLAVQPDGRILVGGAFSYIGPYFAGRQRIARLNSDGSIDMSFDSRLVADDYVYAIALQPDGKILVGGRFSALHTDTAGGTTVTSHLARVNADGSLDSTFQPGIGGVVSSIGLQADGSIVYDRTSLPGEPHQAYVGRLLSTGVADTSFTHVQVDNSVDGLAIQPDGRIVTAGVFSWLGDATTARANIARLTNTGPAVQTLAVTGLGHMTVTWMRSDTAPEVWRATFEKSTDGEQYYTLGAGTRVAGGWQLSGVVLPANQPVFVRALGYYTTGWHNSSASIVESVRQVYLNTTFTDDPLMPGVTAVKAVHITELRSRIDSLRAANGLAAYGWTDPMLSPDETVIGAVHILDLREALRQVYVALGQPAPAYDDPGLAPGTTVRAVHIQQLRTYVRAIE